MSDVKKDDETVAAFLTLLASVRDAAYIQGINARQKKMLYVLRHKSELTKLKAEIAENELRVRRARIDISTLNKASAAAIQEDKPSSE